MQPKRVSWDLLFLLSLFEVPVQLDFAASFSGVWVTVLTKSQIWNSNSTESDCSVSTHSNSPKISSCDNTLEGFCFPEVRKWSWQSDLHPSVSAPGHTRWGTTGTAGRQKCWGSLAWHSPLQPSYSPKHVLIKWDIYPLPTTVQLF